MTALLPIKCLRNGLSRHYPILFCATLVTLTLVADSKSAEPRELNEQLVVSCYRVEITEVVKLLRAGANVNATFGRKADEAFLNRWTSGTPLGHNKWTALMAVARANSYPDPPEKFSKIWEKPELVRAEQKKFTSQALEERRRDELNIMRILLSHGAKIDEDDGYGATALHMAVAGDKPQLARLLLEFGANPNTKQRVYIDGPSNITPLHNACNSRELFELLLKHGANPLAKDSEGSTPIDWVSLFHDRDFDVVVSADGAKVVSRKK